MAEVTRRRTGEFLRELFEIVMAHPEGMQARAALDTLRAQAQLSEYEAGTYESGGLRFEKIVRFATVDCVKAGWLIKHKGYWTITEEGKRAYHDHADPEVFYKRAVRWYGEWKAKQPQGEPTGHDETEGETSGKAASMTFEQAEEQAWHEVEHCEKLDDRARQRLPLRPIHFLAPDV